METVTDRRLLVDERLRRILQLLEERGRVTVHELVREFVRNLDHPSESEPHRN